MSNKRLGIPTLPPFKLIDEPPDLFESGHAVQPIVPSQPWNNRLVASASVPSYPILLAYESWQAVWGFTAGTVNPTYFRNPAIRFGVPGTLIRLPRAVTVNGNNTAGIASFSGNVITVQDTLDQFNVFAASVPNNSGTDQMMLDYFPADSETSVPTPSGNNAFRIVTKPESFSGGQVLNYVWIFVDVTIGDQSPPSPYTRYLGVNEILAQVGNTVVAVDIVKNNQLIDYDLAQLGEVSQNYDKIGYVFLWPSFDKGAFGGFGDQVNQAGEGLVAELAGLVANGSSHVLGVDQFTLLPAMVIADLEDFFGT